jgi:predicted hydrocarbon binding protein
MHGIILSTIQKFVKDEYGAEAWQDVKAKADVDSGIYVPQQTYPDEEVYEIVYAAGEVTGLGGREVLVRYGRYVVGPLAETYSVHVDNDWDAMDLLANVQHFHADLRTHSFSNYTPPSVETGWADDETVYITYDSYRQLCDIARGAIDGAADYYREDLEFVEDHCVFEGDDHCRFLITRANSGRQLPQPAAGRGGFDPDKRPADD